MSGSLWCHRPITHVQGVWLNYAIFPRLECKMDKSVLFNTAMLPLSGLQRHAASLVITHRGHFLPTSASHGFPHPLLWAGRQLFAQENTRVHLVPLNVGYKTNYPHLHEGHHESPLTRSSSPR